MSVVSAARRLVSARPVHPVVSLYLDLDPDQFAVPPARVSQIDSLLDEASREIEGGGELGHEDLMALREDIEWIRSYLLSDEPPFQGARALAVFCSLRDEFFEVVQLPRPAEGRVVIERRPYIEPLIRGAQERRWCVVLVSRRDARLLVGSADRLSELRRVDDDVHGQHQQGGWSQARYERSYEKEADDHLRRVAELIDRRWRFERFDRLAVGGPVEIVARLEHFLAEEVRGTLSPGRVAVDVSNATDDQIQKAVSDLVEQDERERERQALDRLAEGIGSGGRAAGGPQNVLEALNERRVGALLLADDFDRRGGRCPSCGILSLERRGPCPSGDGSELEEVEHLREAAIESALAQDAEVIVVSRYPDLGPFEGIGALLRF
ncbi:MAG: hypothetical protein JO153_06970 [Solirubrobacterales bacterium]|nr:hypothetical protein [Solirubrobacterales bacterium]